MGNMNRVVLSHPTRPRRRRTSVTRSLDILERENIKSPAPIALIYIVIIEWPYKRFLYIFGLTFKQFTASYFFRFSQIVHVYKKPEIT